MKQKLQQFMVGRYGNDSFNRFLCVLSLVMFLLGMIADVSLIYWLGMAVLGYTYFRMLSRNTNRRYQENIAYYQIKQSLTGNFSAWLHKKKTRFALRKEYHYFRCPKCRQELRVPHGKGRIEVTCPKCQTAFMGKS